MQNIYYDPSDSKTMLHVTDFTTNPRFWENSTYRGYSPEKIVFSIAFFDCPSKVSQIKSLKQGDRVILWNIRVKPDKKYGVLEGTVGSKSSFSVLRLAANDPRWQGLSDA